MFPPRGFAAAARGELPGIEVAEKYAAFCAERLAKRNIANACVVSADAGRVFAELLPMPAWLRCTSTSPTRGGKLGTRNAA